jgi:hypothetical protein
MLLDLLRSCSNSDEGSSDALLHCTTWRAHVAFSPLQLPTSSVLVFLPPLFDANVSASSIQLTCLQVLYEAAVRWWHELIRLEL